MVAALYACIAVVVISKKHWLVERLGWRNFMMGSISIYVIGAWSVSAVTILKASR